jgi:glycoside hydrolase-like protein
LKIAKLAPILPALILAACHSQPSPTLTVERPRSSGPARGIDLPTDASDVLNEVKDSRVDFVARYYRDPASRWPTLSASEAQRLSSLGLKIVAVWESHSRYPAYFSYSSGYNDALTAYRQARAVGQPAGSAIYFAVDFDARSQALEPVDQYFRGIAAGFAAASGGGAEYEVGVYGSGAVCDAVKQAGLAQYSWLSNSTAWAGSLSYDGWNIRQGGRLADLSFAHDSNEARDEYGGFRLASYDIAAPYDGAAPRDVIAPRAPREGQWLTTAIMP